MTDQNKSPAWFVPALFAAGISGALSFVGASFQNQIAVAKLGERFSSQAAVVQALRKDIDNIEDSRFSASDAQQVERTMQAERRAIDRSLSQEISEIRRRVIVIEQSEFGRELDGVAVER